MVSQLCLVTLLRTWPWFITPRHYLLCYFYMSNTPNKIAATEAPAEQKKLLGSSVEESRAKRLEKQQLRYRDRGG
jgi:hypothetical protein